MGHMLLNNWMRLFLIDGPSNTFIPHVMPWRIMWHHGSPYRVIFRERMTSGEPMFLNNFPDGCTLDLLGGKCMDVASRKQGVWLYRLVDCRENRSWIPMAGALSSDELGSLTLWLEIDCTILKFMEDLEG